MNGTRHSHLADGSCCAPPRSSLAVLPRQALISKMDAQQHFRGWDLEVEKGIISVELVNEMPKQQLAKESQDKEIGAKKKFRYPTPTDQPSGSGA